MTLRHRLVSRSSLRWMRVGASAALAALLLTNLLMTGALSGAHHAPAAKPAFSAVRALAALDAGSVDGVAYCSFAAEEAGKSHRADSQAQHPDCPCCRHAAAVLLPLTANLPLPASVPWQAPQYRYAVPAAPAVEFHPIRGPPSAA